MKQTVIASLLFFCTFFINVISFAQKPEFGQATYYGDKFNGRRTASGEIFDNKKLTAAHRTHPFGTKLKVTNLKNNKTVVVTVNDRGPFKAGRIIDVTKEAAKELDFVAAGVIDVKVEIYVEEKPPETPTPPKEIATTYQVDLNVIKPEGFGVQVHSFTHIDNLFTELLRIEKEYGAKPMVQVADIDGDCYYRIILGPYADRLKAENKLEKLKKDGLNGFVVDLSK